MIPPAKTILRKGWTYLKTVWNYYRTNSKGFLTNCRRTFPFSQKNRKIAGTTHLLFDFTFLYIFFNFQLLTKLFINKVPYSLKGYDQYNEKLKNVERKVGNQSACQAKSYPCCQTSINQRGKKHPKKIAWSFKKQNEWNELLRRTNGITSCKRRTYLRYEKRNKYTQAEVNTAQQLLNSVHRFHPRKW